MKNSKYIILLCSKIPLKMSFLLGIYVGQRLSSISLIFEVRGTEIRIQL